MTDLIYTVFNESFGQVQPVIEGQGVRRQPIWFDHELVLGRRAAHAAMQGSPRSAINPATTERVPDHAEK